MQVGSKRDFDFEAKDHVTIGEALDVMDFDAASEVRDSTQTYMLLHLSLGMMNGDDSFCQHGAEHGSCIRLLILQGFEGCLTCTPSQDHCD
jgi:hypothetical protein